MILSRVALPVTALLVIGFKLHGLPLPIGLGLGRFLNRGYNTEPVDWLILAVLLVGIGLTFASCRRAPRVLACLSSICLAATTVMALRAWSKPELEIGLVLCSGAPFIVVSLVAIIASPSRRHGAHARGPGTRCASCAYPLGPSGSMACPECGALAPVSDGGTRPPAAP